MKSKIVITILTTKNSLENMEELVQSLNSVMNIWKEFRKTDVTYTIEEVDNV